MNPSFSISGHIVDVVNGTIYDGIVNVVNGKILNIQHADNVEDHYIIPGLIDAHVHIESSMLVPSEFARMAAVHGTVATVSDPHEIANVLGIDGVEYMIENGEKTPFYFFFGAPSCVPATSFESSGAKINASQVEQLLQRDDIYYLSEMMNFPGVIYGDTEVDLKIKAAQQFQKPIDGHAPGLSKDHIKIYANAGISTDHECSDKEEAIEKISMGMKILIREGSAARNFDALISLLNTFPKSIMFCSDDKHPDELVEGHINLLVKRALKDGYDVIDVLRACTLNPVNHYKLPCGLLQPGHSADMVIVDSLDSFHVISTFIKGNEVAKKGKTLLASSKYETPNRFVLAPITENDLQIPYQEGKIRVIKAFDGELLTSEMIVEPKVVEGAICSDIEADILKIVVFNRYRTSKPSIGFIHGFGFTSGALASTVAHDSHNVICIGTNDAEMVEAINAVIAAKGGISISNQGITNILPLPVAGLMSDNDGYKVAEEYSKINELAIRLGGNLKAPFMTLSFMALLVIPDLKMSDKGLFDGRVFDFCNLTVS